MKHLVKKTNMVFGARRRKPKAAPPATLKPPLIGDHNIASSYSHSEILDLISDGPIEGLVAKNGKSLYNNIEMLQGIYLDNTVIAEGKFYDANQYPGTVYGKASSYKLQNIHEVDVSHINKIKTIFSGFYDDNSKLVYKSVLTDNTKVELGINISVKPNSGQRLISAYVDNNICVSSPLHNATQGKIAVEDYGFQRAVYVDNIDTDYIVFNVRPLESIPQFDSISGLSNYKFNTDSYSNFENFIDKYIRPGFDALSDLYNTGNDYNKKFINRMLRNNISPNWLNVTNLASSWAETQGIDINNDLIFRINAPVNENVSINLANAENISFTLNFGSFGRDEQVEGVNVDYKNSSFSVHNFYVPSMNSNGVFGGTIVGFLIIVIKGKRFQSETISKYGNKNDEYRRLYQESFSIPVEALVNLKSITKLTLDYDTQKINQETSTLINTSSTLDDGSNGTPIKYNFTKLLAEFRNGEEYQNVFNFFNRNYVDYIYGQELTGPFRVYGNVRRMVENANILHKGTSVPPDWRNYPMRPATHLILRKNLTAAAEKQYVKDLEKYNNNKTKFAPYNDTMDYWTAARQEGSRDESRISNKGSYSAWNNANRSFDEASIPVTHYVTNSNTTSVIVTLSIDACTDTLTKEIANAWGSETLEVGSPTPALMSFRITTGLIDGRGRESSPYERYFEIATLTDSPFLIDIGNTDSRSDYNEYSFIKFMNDQNQSFANAIDLVPVPNLGNSDQRTEYKRFVRVENLTAETSSSLLKRQMSLVKVVEILQSKMSYPFSAIVGTKIDSRNFDSIPNRTFDCRLKKVRIPSNYYPLQGNEDKRFVTKEQLDTSWLDTNGSLRNDLSLNQIYSPNTWNGTFHPELKWTDNPAWILYDLITNDRYGLGQYIDKDQVDIWELYNIGRFCDAVNDEGYFVGVPDGMGGLEPRFSCNVLFQESEKIYDCINIINSLYRGAIYFYNSEINFVDDRPKKPVALFTNENINDGIFSYANLQREKRINSIEINFIDKNDSFKAKTEYVDDEEDIRQRGMFKQVINSIGITSRGAAIRHAKHLLFSSIKENQTVAFSCGLESLLCRPGDLIVIEDEMKSSHENAGKILNVNSTELSLRLSNYFSLDDYENKITVYAPTGFITKQDNDEKAYAGINATDIKIGSPEQIKDFTITKVKIDLDYGSKVWINPNDPSLNIFNEIKEGSVYRYKVKNKKEELYKIISISEQSANKYNVIASYYESGKYDYIEKNTTLESVELNSYSAPQVINQQSYQTLDSPNLISIETGFADSNVKITANWQSIPFASKYKAQLYYPDGSFKEAEIAKTETSYVFTAEKVGNYNFKVKAIGSTSEYITASYFDSQYSSTGIFVLYEQSSSIKNAIPYLTSININ